MNKKHFNYVDEQFKKITPYDATYKAGIKIQTTKGNTNFISVTAEQLRKIKDILLTPNN